VQVHARLGTIDRSDVLQSLEMA
jgi:hypothetical protein